MMTRTTISLAMLLALLPGPVALAQDASPTPTGQAPAPDGPPPSPRSGRGPQMKMGHRTFLQDGPGAPGFGPGMRMGPPGMWWKNPDLVQKLGLSAEQQKKMDDIFQQNRLQLIDLKANLEKQEVILQPMLDANPPDTGKVMGQIDHVAQARAELEKSTARMLLGIRGVLTADQWTKLQEERRSGRERMFRMKGPDAPGGPGAFLEVPPLPGPVDGAADVGALADAGVALVTPPPVQ